MKIFQVGDKSKAFCNHCSDLVGTTFLRRDVPFSDGKGLAKSILVGACDTCGQTVSIPAQSTPAISKARKEPVESIEVNLPAMFVDVLDCAAFAIDNRASTDFRKTILTFFMHTAAHDARAPKRLKDLRKVADERFPAPRGAERRRLSMKVTASLMEEVHSLEQKTAMNTTDLVKSMVCLVQEDLLTKPQHDLFRQLRVISAISA